MSLNCQTNASPEADYHFYFNGKSIGNSVSGVLSVAVVADGVYTCVPINTVGTGDNATVSITVCKLSFKNHLKIVYFVLLVITVRGQFRTLLCFGRVINVSHVKRKVEALLRLFCRMRKRS